MYIAFGLSLLIFSVVTSIALIVIFGERNIKCLEDTTASTLSTAPKVSIVVSALNEADTIDFFLLNIQIWKLLPSMTAPLTLHLQF